MAKATAKASSRDIATRINTPIAFFTLALLIVESFLGAVLALADLGETLKTACVFTGVALFILVVLLVFWLVANKPQNLVFNLEAHLEAERLRRERQRRAAGAPELEQLAPLVQRALEEKLASDEIVNRLANKPRSLIAEVLRTEAYEITEEINRTAFITVDLSDVNPDTGIVRYPLAALKDVSSLTDEVYFALSPTVRPYYYGVDWVLRDRRSGQVLRTQRMLDGVPPGMPYPDRRDLAAVGIRAGSELEAVRPGAPAAAGVAQPDFRSAQREQAREDPAPGL
jgi:hypothetical protein